MNINQDTLEALDAYQQDVHDQILNRDLVSFKIADINFDDNGHFSVEGDILSTAANKKLANSLRVKESFFNYKRKMEKDDWHDMQEKLKSLNNNTEFVGKRVLNTDGTSTIVKLYQRSEIDAGKGGSNITDIDTYFNMIKSAITGTSKKIELVSSRFDINNEKVHLNFLDKQSDFAVLGFGDDMWRKGSNFSFDMLSFTTSPFFQRLICSNGMVDSSSGFSSNVQNKSFNKADIQRQINKSLVTGEDITDYIKSCTSNLSKINISLDEFRHFENMIRGWGEHGTNIHNRYTKILNKLFGYREINTAYYGQQLEDKSSNWLKSANSGRNAYDFFNDLTWIASHPEKSGLSVDHASRLQAEASKLLFKKNLDMADIAPIVDISVKKIFSDPTDY